MTHQETLAHYKANNLMMRPIRIHYSDGSSASTRINGSDDDIRDYMLGQWINFGDTEEHPADRMVKVTSIEFLD